MLRRHFSLTPLAISIALLLTAPANAQLHFDPSMISGTPGSVADLSQFEQDGNQPAGDYAVDIYLNGVNQASRVVHFAAIEGEPGADIRDGTGLLACLTLKDLADMGVNTALFPALSTQQDKNCLSPGKSIPQAYTAFDFQKMRLDISIPQAAMKMQPRGWIAPDRWDQGINAGLLSYQFSGSENQGSFNRSRSHFLNLTSGLNLGPWRLRDISSWSNYENQGSHQRRWQHQNTWAERAIVPLRSELTAGESTTGNDIFDAFSFSGVQLATDDSMYPDTMRGYAPEIKGIAYSNAQVSVRLHGNVIYRTFVAPGAFTLSDLYPVTSGGDLELEIVEADGSTRTLTIPYSSVPVLQRQGHLRYSLTAGRYRNSSASYSRPSFAQGTLQWGLPHGVTAYGGLQLAENYRAAAIGTGINLGSLGALSADVTQADSTLVDGSRHDGQSLRILYNHSLVATGTTLQLAGYRYSTQGFHSLDETALKGMSGWIAHPDENEAADAVKTTDWNHYYSLLNSKRQRLQINVSQQIERLGSLYITGSRQTYWQHAAANDSLQAGFSSHWGEVSYSVSWTYSRVSGEPHPDNTAWLSLSLPLDTLIEHEHINDNPHPIWASWSASRDGSGHVTQQAGLSGTALEENNLEWSLSQGYGQDAGSNGDVGLDYRGTYGNLSTGYGYTRQYHQLRYGASGGVVFTALGATFGQPLGTTNVLVAAPGAAGVPVENQPGIHTDWRGYTVVPYASVYRENRVALDVNHLGDDVDIDDSVAHVIPTRGALVRADFRAHDGARALITLLYRGQPVPFGATVTVSDSQSSGMVGDEGQVYLSGLGQKGTLLARWGKHDDQQCTAPFQSGNTQSLVQLQATCR